MFWCSLLCTNATYMVQIWNHRTFYEHYSSRNGSAVWADGQDTASEIFPLPRRVLLWSALGRDLQVFKSLTNWDMVERQGWCDMFPATEREAGEVDIRKVESVRSRKRGQNFSIERILGRPRDGQEGEEERRAEEEEEELELEMEEADEEEDDEEEDEEETATHQKYHQLKKEHGHIDHLLGLSPSSKDSHQSQPDRVILPRPPPPPPLRLPPTSPFFPTPSPFSQDPFLLSTPIQSPRYSSIYLWPDPTTFLHSLSHWAGVHRNIQILTPTPHPYAALTFISHSAEDPAYDSIVQYQLQRYFPYMTLMLSCNISVLSSAPGNMFYTQWLASSSKPPPIFFGLQGNFQHELHAISSSF